jgi:hypothetical protein
VAGHRRLGTARPGLASLGFAGAARTGPDGLVTSRRRRHGKAGQDVARGGMARRGSYRRRTNVSN